MVELINVGNRITNQYLLKFTNGIIVIDTGYPRGFDRFRRRFESKGYTQEDIKFIILTHAHDDHAGFLNELIDYCDAPVILSERAIKRLKFGQNVFEGGCPTRLAYFFCLFMKMLGKGKHLFPKVDRADRYITIEENMDVLKANGFPLELINLPGHTSDSIGIISENVIFCGDAAMSGFPSSAKHTIWIENISDYKESWVKMIEGNVDKVYPAHGKPFSIHKLIKHKNFLNGRKLKKLSK